MGSGVRILPVAPKFKSHPHKGWLFCFQYTFELIVHSNYMVVYEIAETQLRILNVVHTAQKCPTFTDNCFLVPSPAFDATLLYIKAHIIIVDLILYTTNILIILVYCVYYL